MGDAGFIFALAVVIGLLVMLLTVAHIGAYRIRRRRTSVKR